MMRAHNWPAPPPPTRWARLRAALHHCTDCGHPEVVHYMRRISPTRYTTSRFWPPHSTTTPLRACYLCGWCHQCALAAHRHALRTAHLRIDRG